jgi:uncharacterized membrane protein
MENTNKEQEDSWHKDSKNWKLGIFYCNKNDKRVFIDKRNPNFGTTLNFGNPKAYPAIFLALLFFGFIVYMITTKQ